MKIKIRCVCINETRDISCRDKSGICLLLGKPKNEREFNYRSQKPGKETSSALYVTIATLQ